MNHIDANKVFREKARQELHKNATSCYMATYFLSLIPSIYDEQEMSDTT